MTDKAEGTATGKHASRPGKNPPQFEDWHGCYDDRWGDLMVPDAYKHPAKFARGLIERIIRHGLEQGYWKRGDLIADPFAGVALGGLVAAYHGLRWIGVEMEPKFVRLGQANIALHARKLAALGEPMPVILQGDSRQFATIIGKADAVITSPPYVSGGHHPDQTGAWGGKLLPGRKVGIGNREVAGYGKAPGQIGQLPAGEVDAIVTSLPFTQGYQSGGGINKKGYGPDGKDKVGERTYQGQGGDRTAGNIETCRVGDVDAVVTSPPYEGINPEKSSASIDYRKNYETYRDSGGGMSYERYVAIQKKHSEGYGESEGQIGKAAGETYWQAVDAVYGQCLQAIRPGGYMAVVVKDCVKKKKRVGLCDQTLRLLRRIGFEPVERIRAHLVVERRSAGLFGPICTRTERKSFFRRLAEAKGSPRIDWEEVLFVRKPAAVAGSREPVAGCLEMVAGSRSAVAGTGGR